MKITQSIVLLLLVSSVVSLSIRSHSVTVNTQIPYTQNGTPVGILTYTAKNGIPRQQTVLGGRNMFPEDIAPYTPVTFSVLQPIPNVQTRSASMTWLPNFTEVRIYGHGDLRINGF